MYRTCIFCSKDLGTNEVIEHFPVGSRLAFDSHKGRLWAICPRCTRWNLAPIEERWEAVEEAEEQFRGSRMRVQSENIGMAKMPDGTRLVRVGSALPGELAAWRYGTQLLKRRTHLYMAMGAGAVTGAALLIGAPLIAGVGIPFTAINPVIQLSQFAVRQRQLERVVLKLPAHESPTGKPLVLRRRDLNNSRILQVDGAFSLSIPEPAAAVPWYRLQDAPDQYGPRMQITGAVAQSAAARVMVDYNSKGAKQAEVTNALNVLQEAGSAQDYLDKIARSQPTIIPPSKGPRGVDSRTIITPRKIMASFRGERLPVVKSGYVRNADPVHPLQRIEALALEMALHDESERRAMEGELELLEDAWREAEYIARIADALPDDPPEDDASPHD